MQSNTTTTNIERIQAELEALENQLVEIEGRSVKPSQCYRFETSPAHLMFNTNCPDNLRQQVQAILDKYLADEGRS